MTCVVVRQESEPIFFFDYEFYCAMRRLSILHVQMTPHAYVCYDKFSFCSFYFLFVSVYLFFWFESITKASWLSKFPRKLMILNGLTRFFFVRRLKDEVSDAYLHIRHRPSLRSMLTAFALSDTYIGISHFQCSFFRERAKELLDRL